MILPENILAVVRKEERTAMEVGGQNILRRFVGLAFGGLLILCGSNSPGFAAPSFDCTKATSRAEKTICASDELGKLDSELSTAYRSALAEGRTSAVLQRKWLKSRDTSCEKLEAPDSCLNVDMSLRINSLKNEVEIEGVDSIIRVVSLTKSDAVGKAINGLNEGAKFNKSSSSVESCQRLIEFVAGREDEVWAGVCSVKTDGTLQTTKVCADDMVGHFYEELPANGETSYGDLARMATAHCVGG